LKTLPNYYSSLEPFREAFRQGKPVLTYHHIGPRRRGARIKGLYVNPRLFSRQLAELRAAGFSTPPFGAITSNDSEPGKVFITIDDGFRDVLENGLPILKEAGMRAVLFIVSGLIGKSNEWQQRAGDISEPLINEAEIREWLSAGQEIGSHTVSHAWLTRLSPEAAGKEITASKKALEDRFGVAIDHFCYPFGDWNDGVRDQVIAAGYKTASTTVTGVNTPADSVFALKRVTARYPSGPCGISG